MITAAEQHEQVFRTNRGHLLGLAYRMLGSYSEAEDIVQETWIRWSKAGGEDILRPLAFLRKITTRLCLDYLKSARQRREQYVGPWLPEPLPDYLATGTDEAVLANDVTMSLLVTMERLSPAERAAFLLHDIFDLPFAEIASILDRAEPACRQLAARARKLVRGRRRRFRTDRDEAERLTTAFIQAARQGDVEQLKRILAEDVVVYSDGGGQRIASLNVLEGADRVTRFFAGIRKHQPMLPHIIYRGRINAAPGFISLESDGLPQAVSLEIENGKIAAVFIVRNPDKLRLVRKPVASLGWLAVV
jgi:RNA polymerase sigma-70 factor (ECF subfamily)